MPIPLWWGWSPVSSDAREAHAGAREPIDVRGGELAAVAAEVRVAEVVGDDEDDVGPPRARSLRSDRHADPTSCGVPREPARAASGPCRAPATPARTPPTTGACRCPGSWTNPRR